MPENFENRHEEENLPIEIPEEEKPVSETPEQPKISEKSEKDKNELDKVKNQLGDFFDKAKSTEEKFQKIQRKFSPFIKAGIIDEKDILDQVNDCSSEQDKDSFVKKAMDLVKIYNSIKNSDIGEDILRSERVERLREEGRTVINNVLDYETTPDKKTILIHIVPAKKPGLKKLRELMGAGLDDLVEIVEENDEIIKVEANSWLVDKNPKLVEKLGFKVGDKYVDGDGRNAQCSRMTREEFLQKPWNSENRK